MQLIIAIVLILFELFAIDAMPSSDKKLTLRILHTNDMHSRFEETSRMSGSCSDKDAQAGLCYGGFARIATFVRSARRSATYDRPVLFLNAGDTYQGTKLYSHYKWKIVARFLNVLRPDVASLGNHEFDDRVAGLIPFLNNVTFPVVAANLNLDKQPDLAQARQLRKSTVLVVNNRKIGVIGYLTNETATLSKTDNVTFIDEVVAIREEAKKLKSQGIDIIIALGHSGYGVDKRIAREVEDLDLVVGGHTNTFLWNGAEPDSEKIEGPYPTVVEQSNGRKVFVVQAYAFTKYLGDITVDFDRDGEVTRIEGQPVLVDSRVPKAQDVEEELQRWIEPLKNASSEVIGTTKVLLQGDDKTCKLWECNFGDLITDAMIYYNANKDAGLEGWTDAPIAIQHAGGIRSSIGSTSDDTITKDDILTAFPYFTEIYKMKVKGEVLSKVLEWSVNDRVSLNVTQQGGSFLQMSGMRVAYNLSRPVNSRVVFARTRCNLCLVPTYHRLDADKIYTILLPDYIANGYGGYEMLRDLPRVNLNVTDVEVVTEYIRQTSPVYPEVEGRIKLFGGTKQEEDVIKYKILTIDQLDSSTNSAAEFVYTMSIVLTVLCFIIVTRL